jgi:hypothetical protein
MYLKKALALTGLVGSILVVCGCGGEGPFGNNAPQGRPDWMKKDAAKSPPADAPKQQ